MSDDPHPCKVSKHKCISSFIVNTLLLSAVAAYSQEQKVPQSTSDDKNTSTLTIGAENIAALTLEQDKTTFYNCLAPSFSARTQNERGDYAAVSGVQGIIYNDNAWNTTTIKFMVELGKQLGDGGVITFKAGREATEGRSVFDNPFNYYANATDVVTLGNSTERIVFGYQKNNNFVELGVIGKSGDGFYVVPNPKEASFWAKGGLTLLQKSGMKLDMSSALRLDKKRAQMLAAFGMHNRYSGARVFGHYDFKQHQGNFGIRAYRELKNGWKVIAESVLTQHKDLSIRSGIGKDGVQFSVELKKPKQENPRVNLTVTSYLARSKTYAYRK